MWNNKHLECGTKDISSVLVKRQHHYHSQTTTKESPMKHYVLSLAAVLIVLCTVSQAQEGNSTSRLEKQHKTTHFMKNQLKHIEASLVTSLTGASIEAQRSAIQTLRDLEQLFPEYPFSSIISPLETILKGETSDPIARKLAALALDELHSDAGDSAIKEVSEISDDIGLQTLCQALLVKDLKKLN
jgi:hypothetical protein